MRKKTVPAFRVVVTRAASMLGPASVVFDHTIASQNAVHAAACGLALAGGGDAAVIDVQALRPVAGRPPMTRFAHCSHGQYGFCFASRSSVGDVPQGGGADAAGG